MADKKQNSCIGKNPYVGNGTTPIKAPNAPEKTGNKNIIYKGGDLRAK